MVRSSGVFIILENADHADLLIKVVLQLEIIKAFSAVGDIGAPALPAARMALDADLWPID